ncbi:MAG: response regulator [Vicinamibacterales bacterium]
MKQILLAEDDRFLRRACQAKLEQAGFAVRTAVNGEEALSLARTSPPDLMLLDLLMPKLDGLGVLRAMRADSALRDITVVILSNSSKELEMQNADSLGAAGYWIKSNLSLQEICSRVRALLGSPDAAPTDPVLADVAALK